MFYHYRFMVGHWFGILLTIPNCNCMEINTLPNTSDQNNRARGGYRGPGSMAQFGKIGVFVVVGAKIEQGCLVVV